MRSRHEAYRLANSVCKSLRKKYGERVRLVALCGSWSYGYPHHKSDLDIQAVIDETSEHRLWTIEDFEVDFVSTATADVEKKLSDARQFGWSEMMTLGDILHCEPSIGGYVQALIVKRYRTGMPPLDNREMFDFRRIITSRINAVHASANLESATQTLTISLAVAALCEWHIRASGQWKRRAEQYLQVTKATDDAFYNIVKSSLDEQKGFAERLDILENAKTALTELIKASLIIEG